MHLRSLLHSPAVEWVRYAGLERQSWSCQKYFDKCMCSGMVTFGIKSGRRQRQIQKALKLLI